MENEIIIPQEWSDVTLGEFIQLSKLDIETFDDKLDYYFRILKIFGNKHIYDIKEYIEMATLVEITNSLSFLNTVPKKQEINQVNIDGVDYFKLKNLNTLTVGEYLSIEQTIDSEKLNGITAIPVILSVILRPKDEKFNAGNVPSRRKLFSDKLSIEQTYQMGLFFSNGER